MQPTHKETKKLLSPCRKIKTFLSIALGMFITLLSVSSLASESSKSTNISQNPTISVSQSELAHIRSALEGQQKTIKLILDNLANDEHEALEAKVESIENSLSTIEKRRLKESSQANKNSSLEDKVKSVESSLNTITNRDDYFTYADWAAVAITCVAVLLTIVGLAIAALAFWGYREIRELTKRSAATEAKSVAEKTMEEMINGVAKSELEKLINDGKLRQPLQDAVDMILRNGSNNSDRERTKELLDELDIDESEFDDSSADESVTGGKKEKV